MEAQRLSLKQHAMNGLRAEKHLLELLDDNLKTGGTFVDVGAHVGYYSLYARDIIGKNGYILMLEPNRLTHPILINNFKQHGIDIDKNMDSVFLYRVAASNEISIRLFRSDYYTEASRLLPVDHERQSENEYAVSVATLDSMITDADFVKIDAEGEEYKILLGMHNLLTNSKPFLLIEIHHDQNIDLMQIVELLNNYGYTCFGRNEPEWYSQNKLVATGNVFERTKHLIALHLKPGEPCPY